LTRVIVGKESLLGSVLVNHLAKIPLLVEQPHADDRHPQIAGGFELIAGDIAKSAGVTRSGPQRPAFNGHF
jgi:hypothetical protein